MTEAWDTEDYLAMSNATLWTLPHKQITLTRLVHSHMFRSVNVKGQHSKVGSYSYRLKNKNQYKKSKVVLVYFFSCF